MTKGLFLSGHSFMNCVFTRRIDRWFSGFTRTISWLSSLSSCSGHWSSATPSSLYVELAFDLQIKQAIFEFSDYSAHLFWCTAKTHLVFTGFLLRFLVRVAAIAGNRRQISRSRANNEWQQTADLRNEARKCTNSGIGTTSFYRTRISNTSDRKEYAQFSSP